MPLYEYRCESCGAEEEKLQAISAPAAHDCPDCGVASGMKRRLSVAAFALSGAGVYKAAAKEPPAPAESSSAPSTPKAGGCCGGSCACPA